jgi:RNA polymerase sigma factor (sigma-70 family)
MKSLKKCFQGVPSFDGKIHQEMLNRKDEREIRQKLILNNLKLVAKVVLEVKRLYSLSNYSLDIEDMFQEGVIALMKAIENFDAKKGSFSHYAYWFIRRYIELFVFFEERLIRLPKNKIVVEILRFEDDYYKKYGKRPSLQEIMKNFKIERDALLMLKRSFFPTISLEKKMGEDEDSILEEIIGQDNQEKIKEEILDDSSPSWMTILNEREKLIIHLRYGFFGECNTLEEVGKRLGCTKERIRQIEKEALKKISSYIKNQNSS